MPDCSTCFHWTIKERSWGVCDNRNGIATEPRAKLLTRCDFVCRAYSQKFMATAIQPKIIEPKAQPPAAAFSQVDATQDVEKDKRAVGKRKVSMTEHKPQNVWEQGGATTPIKVH